VQLVRGHRERVDVQFVHIDGNLANRLNGIAVHVDAALAGHRANFGDRLQHAGLVVREHHRHEPRVGTHGGNDGVSRNTPVEIGRDARHLVHSSLELGPRFDY